jgi:membrane-bound ClpP family serine protease
MNIIALLASIDPIAGICFIIGLGLVIFEMFHPGLSAPGILGCVLLIAGIILTARTAMDAVILLIIILAILGAALTIVVHSATKGHLSRVLVLSDSLNKEAKNAVLGEMDYFIGKEGVALTPLRPSGSADFDGVRLDVISDGEFIANEKRIKIIRLENRRIMVKEIK